MEISEGLKKYYLVCHSEPNKLLVFDLLPMVTIDTFEQTNLLSIVESQASLQLLEDV